MLVLVHKLLKSAPGFVLAVVDLPGIAPRAGELGIIEALFEKVLDLTKSAVVRYRDEWIHERVGFICRIERPLLDQIANKIEVPFANREMQGGRVVILTGEQRRTTLSQSLHAVQIAVLACGEHLPNIGSG